MAYFRKLPSGKWQATVRDRSGTRHTFTDPLKSVVKAWAIEQESLLARGAFRDPRLGETRIGAWHARVAAASGIEEVTKDKNASLWRTHCESRWAAWPIAAPGRLEAQAWVDDLKSTKLARHHGKPAEDADDVPVLSAATVHDVVHLMSSLYRLAMRENPPLVAINPFADLDLPRIEPRPIEFYEREEATALYAAVEEVAGTQWRTLVELGMDVGLRPGEIYGLHGHRVDWLRAKIQVIDVMTRKGLRQWPKSKRSHRVVPVPAHTLEGMSILMAGLRRDSLVFTAPMGGPVRGALPEPRVVSGNCSCWGSAVCAASNAAHICVLAGAGRRTSVRRSGPSRSRGLCDDAALRASGSRRAQ